MFAAGPAGFAFIVSFLVGLISGVGFGSIILRALLSAMIFAGIGMGISLIGKTLFPELVLDENNTTDQDTDGDGEPEKASGGTVDITLEDDEEDNNTVTPQSGGGLFSEDDEFVEEIQSSSSTEPEAVVSGEENGESDEALDSFESVDGLPSLDAFSDSFESSWDTDSSGGSAASGQEADIDIMGETQNPGEVAKAVKTMMKRDQEG
ncbi:hypothetical protein [Marispirochaeta sp.]|jgi:hypothetical protein|uniref:hypothetical protein n=1 Tax=Marispirochaeta sp. TaxID=2038653 RepID=UPI0037480784